MSLPNYKMSLPENFELLLSCNPETCRPMASKQEYEAHLINQLVSHDDIERMRPMAKIDPYAETRKSKITDNPQETNIIYRDTDSVYINPGLYSKYSEIVDGTITIHLRLTGDKKYGVILQRSSSSTRLDVVGLPHMWIEFDPKCFSIENENKMFDCKGRFCQCACSWSLSAKCNLSSILCIDSEKKKVIKILDHGMIVASLSIDLL